MNQKELKADAQLCQGTQYLWKLPACADAHVISLAAQYNLSVPIMQAVVKRGFSSKSEIDSFLFATSYGDDTDLECMADAQKAVDRIRLAIDRGERILIFGDYDVDGMTATAMVMYCLLTLGARVNFYLPNRFTDGYGLSVKAVETAARNGYTLIMTVDNGITAFHQAELAKDLGVDLIITDHHRPLSILPVAYAVVNPMRSDCPYPCKFLAGVGVAYKLMVLLFKELNKKIPDRVYELVALGTIADVVPLKDENRFLVRHGLSYINRDPSVALQVLKQNNMSTKEQLASLDIGFSIAPQLNALGRLSDPRQAIAFLIGSDTELVAQVGRTLFELNQTRKEVERSILSEVEDAIQRKSIDLDTENIIMAAHAGWPVGVIGLVAARLVSQYHRPAFLFHITDDGKAKGSARSIQQFNLFEALEANADILERYGGHCAAAGLSLSIEKVSLLKERLEQRIAAQLTPYDLKPTLVLDATVQLSELTRKFLSDMAYLEPFGHQNEQPLFYIKGLIQVQDPVLLKGQHVKCQVAADGIVKPIIFFNRPDLYQLLVEHKASMFDCAAYVTENHWNGRVSIELQGLDIMLGVL